MWNLDFKSPDVQNLLFNKFVVFIGDSVVRTMYKDLVLLLQDDRPLTHAELRKKGEGGFLTDSLVEGSELTNSKNYREVRQYQHPNHLVRFYFVTQVYNAYMETVITDLSGIAQIPDIVVINSCLWDLSRYGPNPIPSYELNVERLFKAFKKFLSQRTLVIWTTSMPVSQSVRGGFMLNCIQFLNDWLRADVVAANYFASNIARQNGFDSLDLHYYFRREIEMRELDGVHWNSVAHRRISNLLLQHICKAWGVRIPQAVLNDDQLWGGVNLPGNCAAISLLSNVIGGLVRPANMMNLIPFQSERHGVMRPMINRQQRRYEPYRGHLLDYYNSRRFF